MSFTSDKNELRRILNSHKIGECTTEEETAFITVFFRLYHPDWYNKLRVLCRLLHIRLKLKLNIGQMEGAFGLYWKMERRKISVSEY